MNYNMVEIESKLKLLSHDKLTRIVSDLLKQLGSDALTFVCQHPDYNNSMDTVFNQKETVINKKEMKVNSFSMANYSQRHIAMQVQYDGVAYSGFASQNDEETVEKHLFDALLKLRLISDRKTCNYSRCGRTDKGVSALGQVIACNVRSALPKSSSSLVDDSCNSDKVAVEMDYCSMMNRCLPTNIRILGWCEVTPDFSARFSASFRSYRYFFTEKKRNIANMQLAASYFVGVHGFLHLCKMDLANVSNFEREVYSAKVTNYHTCPYNHEHSIWMLEIKGVAFLWHMVRCIMAVLLLVGDGLEDPCVVQQLVDINRCKGKPSYAMAPEQPLVLHECGYENLRIQMQPNSLWNLTAHFESVWEEHTIAATRARNALAFIHECQVKTTDVAEFAQRILKDSVVSATEKRKFTATEPDSNSHSGSELGRSVSDSVCWSDALTDIHRITMKVPVTKQMGPYIPLMQRRREESYEEKVKNLSGGRKERFQRKVEVSAAAVNETPKFFTKMRQQGSV